MSYKNFDPEVLVEILKLRQDVFYYLQGEFESNTMSRVERNKMYAAILEMENRIADMLFDKGLLPKVVY